MRRNKTKAALAALVGGALAIGALLAPSAAVADETRSVPVMDGMAASAFAAQLGASRTGGAYVDGAGRGVVAVTDAAAAQSVRAAGGIPQLVTRSAAYLQSITAELDESAGIPGTSWGVDPSTNQVSVETDDTVTGAKLARVHSVAARFGDAVRVERIPGKLTVAAAFTSGGQGIENSSQSLKCSLGFNTRNSAGARYFLTAGHCGDDNSTWYKASDGTYLGTNHESSFPGNDFAVVTYRNSAVSAYGTVWVNGVQQQISSSRYPSDGESVARVGTVSSDLTGAVLLTSTTVTYDDGSKVTGMIKTSLCAQHGDSGGAMFHGSVALGITSGGTNLDSRCSTSVSDRRSYYQPVQEVLDHAGLRIY